MNRAEILGTAKSHVTKDRNTTHGEPEDSFGMIARLWSARLGITLRSDQVCIMLCDLKTARAWTNPKHADNWIDLAGYAACGGECADPTPTVKTKPVTLPELESDAVLPTDKIGDNPNHIPREKQGLRDMDHYEDL